MNLSDEEILSVGCEVLELEANSILKVVDRLGSAFVEAARTILAHKGRVIVTGMGKSGLISQKIAATLASTGTPAFYLHAGEAMHGDLGMIVKGDVIIAVSYSGATEELIRWLPAAKRLGCSLIAITGMLNSELANRSDIVLDAGVEREACPLNLAPTNSTTVAMAIGDALSMTLLKMRGFKEEDFALLHPSGSLGRKLVKVDDLMISGEALPLSLPTDPMNKIIIEMSSKRLGLTCIVKDDRTLLGILTDGDLRRAMEASPNMLLHPAEKYMSLNPKLIDKEALVTKAVKIMEENMITALVIVDSHKKVEGVIKLQDILKAGVV